ncbi:GTPase-activating protein SAC7 [Wickerhamiella sorbophila]|uniref:GTPase-activating protein SAC7 n=1 Tax=Wickerhamiella sorbophila TaxID=45607 RepID=A0A2T0FCQ9_9ASCO|nr:GTPase-activating protein SAC7 [Wickerhamiella sorbophila]PRT52750.1 GTPase-activating protein SAC7 [Wickerhamiella sorbophila]
MPEATLSSSPSKHLTSWWRSFKQRDESNESSSSLASRPHLPHMSQSSSAITKERSISDPPVEVSNQGRKVTIPRAVLDSPIFGVPLATSIKYASVRISLTDKEGESFVYGYVPVVVAKTAMFIKKEGKTVDGIFRVSGSTRRVNVLKDVFNLAPRFGKDVDWQGFNVHDASSLLRRYFSSLPESIIPLKGYDTFRAPILEAPQLRAYMENQATLLNPALAEGVEEIHMDSTIEAQTQEAIVKYQRLIFTLPPINLHLLVYLLDLLSVVASNSELNRMPAYNLSAVFQPTILANPQHTNVEEYLVSRLAVEFIIIHARPILQKVEELAREEHEKLKELQGKPQAHTKEPVEEQPQLSVPEIITPAETPTNEEVFPAKLTVSGLQEDANEPSEPKRHRRRHSKSLSSVPPASNDSNRQQPGWNRRKPTSTEEPTNESTTSLAGAQSSTTTASFEEGDDAVAPRPRKESLKSRWRRSLMILRPSDEDDSAGLSPSMSWFKAKRNRDDTPLSQSPTS